MKIRSSLISGYSLIEAFIAAFIIAVAVGAAAIMAHNMNVTQSNDGNLSRAVNLQEQAAKLYALGLSPQSITNILPEPFTNATNPNFGVYNLLFTTNSTNITGVGTLETATCRILFRAGQTFEGTNTYRSNVVTVVRPSIR